MRNRNKKVLIVLSLGTCVAAQLALGMCHYAMFGPVNGTLRDCSSSCVQHTYFPSIMVCTNTCDTLSCYPDDWVKVDDYWAIGTCSNGKCINVVTGESPGSYVQEYGTGDGCSTPCGGF